MGLFSKLFGSKEKSVSTIADTIIVYGDSTKSDNVTETQNKCNLCDSRTDVIKDLVSKLEKEKENSKSWYRDYRKERDKTIELQDSIKGTQPLVSRLYKEAFKDTNTIANLRLIVDSRELEVFRLNEHIEELKIKLQKKSKKK